MNRPRTPRESATIHSLRRHLNNFPRRSLGSGPDRKEVLGVVDSDGPLVMAFDDRFGGAGVESSLSISNDASPIAYEAVPMGILRPRVQARSLPGGPECVHQNREIDRASFLCQWQEPVPEIVRHGRVAFACHLGNFGRNVDVSGFEMDRNQSSFSTSSRLSPPKRIMALSAQMSRSVDASMSRSAWSTVRITRPFSGSASRGTCVLSRDSATHLRARQKCHSMMISLR